MFVPSGGETLVGLDFTVPHDRVDESADRYVAATLRYDQMMERFLE
jgi:hypothetical protein